MEGEGFFYIPHPQDCLTSDDSHNVNKCGSAGAGISWGGDKDFWKSRIFFVTETGEKPIYYHGPFSKENKRTRKFKKGEAFNVGMKPESVGIWRGRGGEGGGFRRALGTVLAKYRNEYGTQLADDLTAGQWIKITLPAAEEGKEIWVQENIGVLHNGLPGEEGDEGTETPENKLWYQKKPSDKCKSAEDEASNCKIDNIIDNIPGWCCPDEGEHAGALVSFLDKGGVFLVAITFILLLAPFLYLQARNFVKAESIYKTKNLGKWKFLERIVGEANVNLDIPGSFSTLLFQVLFGWPAQPILSLTKTNSIIQNLHTGVLIPTFIVFWLSYRWLGGSESDGDSSAGSGEGDPTIFHPALIFDKKAPNGFQDVTQLMGSPSNRCVDLQEEVLLAKRSLQEALADHGGNAPEIRLARQELDEAIDISSRSTCKNKHTAEACAKDPECCWGERCPGSASNYMEQVTANSHPLGFDRVLDGNFLDLTKEDKFSTYYEAARGQQTCSTYLQKENQNLCNEPDYIVNSLRLSVPCEDPVCTAEECCTRTPEIPAETVDPPTTCGEYFEKYPNICDGRAPGGGTYTREGEPADILTLGCNSGVCTQDQCCETTTEEAEDSGSVGPSAPTPCASFLRSNCAPSDAGAAINWEYTGEIKTSPPARCPNDVCTEVDCCERRENCAVALQQNGRLCFDADSSLYTGNAAMPSPGDGQWCRGTECTPAECCEKISEESEDMPSSGEPEASLLACPRDGWSGCTNKCETNRNYFAESISNDGCILQPGTPCIAGMGDCNWRGRRIMNSPNGCRDGNYCQQVNAETRSEVCLQEEGQEGADTSSRCYNNPFLEQDIGQGLLVDHYHNRPHHPAYSTILAGIADPERDGQYPICTPVDGVCRQADDTKTAKQCFEWFKERGENDERTAAEICGADAASGIQGCQWESPDPDNRTQFPGTCNEWFYDILNIYAEANSNFAQTGWERLPLHDGTGLDQQALAINALGNDGVGEPGFNDAGSLKTELEAVREGGVRYFGTEGQIFPDCANPQLDKILCNEDYEAQTNDNLHIHNKCCNT